MMWPVSRVENLIATHPGLGIALLQMVSQRTAILSKRLLSFAAETNGQRLVRELIRLSERLGTREIDGSIKMMPLTQTLLAQCVGTSREIVTCYMNRLREDGCVRYSRKAITVYPEALKACLQGETVKAMANAAGLAR
jgi:CRP-like cAMP-binding protein